MSSTKVGGAKLGEGLSVTNGTLKVESLNGLKLWKGTQVEYDQIITKDPSTLYFITD